MGKPPIGLIIMGGLAVAAVSGAVAFLGVSDVLPGDIAIALTPAVPARSPNGFDFMIVDGPPTGALRVVQVMLLGLLIGGIPSALTGRLLAARTERARAEWTSVWSGVFVAGFVFQLSSLVITAAMFLWIVGTLVEWWHWSTEATVVGLVLSCSIASSAFALRSWRVLLVSVVQERIQLAGPT
jgi:hypothetical protein